MACFLSMFRAAARFACFSTIVLFLNTVASSNANAGVLKSELVISSGLALPIHADSLPGDPNHLYIAEERVARLTRLDLTTNQLFTVLDLPNIEQGNQTGLNGFAFHPNFASNGKLYVNLSGDAEGNIRILEYTRSTVNPNVFDPTTEREILTVSNPSFSHMGGWIGFGPHDGYLYMGFGDGGNVPPQETKGLPAQDLNSLKGKILRVDVNGDDYPLDDSRNYAIPATNPFASGGGAPEVFVYGLRHPFRNGFDSETGDLYIADVGSRLYEEINFVPAGSNGGQNFGWRPREGFQDNPDFDDPSPANAVDPIHAYDHGPSAAVIGGPVYHGEDIPWLEGTYIFADHVQKTFFTLRYDGQDVSDFTDRTAELASSLGSYGGITSFAQDANGEFYMVDYLRGDIYRILARTSTEAGDYNQNGVVDTADYTFWRDTLGNDVDPGTGADGSGNGKIDRADYTVWKSFYGREVGEGGTGSLSSIVPEPATATLWLLGLTGLGIGLSRRIR